MAVGEAMLTKDQLITLLKNTLNTEADYHEDRWNEDDRSTLHHKKHLEEIERVLNVVANNEAKHKQEQT